MLVYSSHFVLEPKRGVHQVIECIARWLGRRSKGFVDPSKLLRGMRDRLRDESFVESRATLGKADSLTHPFYFCARLSHSDDTVSGRRWLAEIGLRQADSNALLECSFLLRTDEVSARVTAPIQVTRPKLIQDLVQTCNPSQGTPGLRVKLLDDESARAFLSEVERLERKFPIVLISHAQKGRSLVAPERLQSLLVGIADIVQVPASADSFAIASIVGRKYTAWGGAINVIFPPRRGDRGIFCETVLFRPDELLALADEGKAIDSEILARVTHRTNLPYSWRHISLETVNHEILRRQLSNSIQNAKNSDESAEYVALLEDADQQLRTKDDDIALLRMEVEEKEGEVRNLQAKVDGLKHALSGRQSRADTNDNGADELAPLRHAMEGYVSGNPTLEQSLTIVSVLFPDRVAVLDSAFESASASGMFKFGGRAFELLWKLVTDYWSALSAGKGDMHAKGTFGHNAYAQRESAVLSKEGKGRRTFDYRGQSIFMDKHLKIGVKDSAAETLRVHFEWVADEKKIVIGHCGKHLDF